MACITTISGSDVTGRLATGFHAIMAGDAIAHERAVIQGRPCPHCCGVTHIAFQAGSQVTGWQAMTVGTTRAGLGVVEGKRHPVVDRMTGIANVAGRRMCRAHSAGIDTIVTADAGSGHRAVIKGPSRHTSATTRPTSCASASGGSQCRQPSEGNMAGGTIIGGHNVRYALAGGDNTVVTTLAASNGFGMIDCHSDPSCHRMTGFTYIRC